MTISIIEDNKSVDVKFHKFSDGASYLKFELSKAPKEVVLTIENEPADTIPFIIDLFIDTLFSGAAGVLDANKVDKILHLPYFPFARADRNFENGNLSPLKPFLSGMGFFFKEIITNDLHNESAVREYLDQAILGETVKLVNKPQVACFNYTAQKQLWKDDIPVLKRLTGLCAANTVLVAPDKGARQKTVDTSYSYQLPYITCEKERDVTTGWIKSFKISEYVGVDSVEGKDVIILDDICDGGATFKILAKSLKELGAKTVTLYVTHGIFSKPLEEFKPYIDYIMCFQTVMNYVTLQDIVKYNKGDL